MHVTANERLVVRTQYPGQALRVQLVLAQKEADLSLVAPQDATTVAELVIEPGCRVIIGRDGIRHEQL